ncbi:unnamed protein product [Callosobruchus maculatus]|uniref:Uncharacterized protein n=1 Tax=Callosobruchus maculatus TaxID=64391 RepID=A0A653CR36_CALMS|nr:unnamed protein product [Callosobruchus maculatus]
MLGLQYEPSFGVPDYEAWPHSKYVPVDIPDYRVTKQLDYYESWPSYYPIYYPIREFRSYLNRLLARDLRLSKTKYVHTYW